MMNNASHAYRSSYSTTTALLELSEELYRCADEKKVSTIMTLDQSAAFDCIQHQLLIDKLRLYNLDDAALKWVTSYLEYRSQFVSIGTAKSDIFPMYRGVPQGSVLGPLQFSIFTNDLSEAIRDPGCPNPAHLDSEKLFGPDCDLCGKIIQYADDTTYHIASKHREKNQQKMDQNLLKLADYLTSNQLVVNKDKTQIEEVMVKQKRCKISGTTPEIQTLNSKQEVEIIKVQGHCRILGLNVQNDLSWNSHLETGSKPLLPAIRRSLGNLRHLGKLVPFKSRNILARGMILSKLSYLISICGGATPNLIRKAQVTQNAAARWVTGKMRNTRISTLLEVTGWFSIKEMSKLQSATILWKAVNLKTPRNMYERLNWNELTSNFNMTEPRINITKNNYLYRACKEWNKFLTVWDQSKVLPSSRDTWRSGWDNRDHNHLTRLSENSLDGSDQLVTHNNSASWMVFCL